MIVDERTRPTGEMFRGALLDGADFSRSFVTADFTGARLRGARLVGANVKACRFDGADLVSSRRVSRSLWPREHGAYAQLGIPLTVALVARPPTWAAALLATAAVLAFVGHEPLLVVLGHRGARVREAEGARARARLAVLASAAAIAGGAGVALASPAAREMIAIAAIPTIALIALAWRRAEHSLAGELVAAVALSGAGAPVAVAAGASIDAALAVWSVWALGYAASVVAVHQVLAHQRRRGRRPADHLVALGLAGTGVLAASASPAALPLVAIAVAVAVVLPPARRLRAIGVALVVASAASAAMLLI